MRLTFFNSRLMAILSVMAMLTVSCKQEETTLGLDLTDPNTLYNGKRGTALLQAVTVADDSLSTVGFSSGVFGNATFAGLGDVEAVLYSQISIANSTGISLSDEVEIDSVVMTLVIDTAYPKIPDSAVLSMHLVMHQLAEPLQGDSNYRATASIAEEQTTFYDGMVDYIYGSDSVRVRLDESIYPVLKQTCSREDFLQRTKGFSLRLAQGSNALVSVNLAATATRITLHYHTATAQALKYNFVINSSAVQFMHYGHNFAGTPLQVLNDDATASVDGSQRLYLLPLGGTKVRVDLQEFIDTFRVNHSTATIHYAELVLPVAAESDTLRVERVIAARRTADGASVYVSDANVLSNPYTYSGFDGYYHAGKNGYRMRLTQHLQELLRTGKDYGTELIIDARRSRPFVAVLNGTATDNPPHIDFIYTE